MITRTATLEKVAQTDGTGFYGMYDNLLMLITSCYLSENMSFCQKQVLLEGLQPHSCFSLMFHSLRDNLW